LQERMKLVHRSPKDQGNSLGNIEQALEAERERSKKELRRIVSWKSDPVVYVRNYNRANLAVYHGALFKTHSPERLRRILRFGEILRHAASGIRKATALPEESESPVQGILGKRENRCATIVPLA
ncbi:MAG TPA: hypothetical protein VEM32_09445, partial [Geobacteraceae bacterium]|nr:hypothetical protein [Geobacteraceae bacterium]